MAVPAYSGAGGSSEEKLMEKNFGTVSVTLNNVGGGPFECEWNGVHAVILGKTATTVPIPISQMLTAGGIT